MKKLVIALCALAAASVQAGVKYWDNQAFKAYDADAYVQDGLVLNFDGIRNQGLAQPHSDSATTWVNLGSGGSANSATAWSRNTSNTSTSWTKNSILYGEWTDDGFFFNQRSRWEIPGSFSLDQFTVQLVTDITRTNAQDSSGRMYAVFGNGNNSNSQSAWKTLGVATLKSAGYGNGMYFPVDNWGFSKRPSISDATVKYFTGALDTSAAYAISGTDLSAATTANYGYISGRTVSGSVSFTGICLGSNGNGSQSLTGTIKNFRLYPSRVLSTDELVWNRAIDNYRFFATPFSSIPVTNAVIASAVEGLSIRVPAAEPLGCYAVDASGYTFTAPATTNVNGRTYTCTGYTHEEWDSATGDWGTPVLQSGVLAAPVAASDRVRITWQWTAGDGIVTRYDVGNYVQDGLLYHYDGIRNLGVDQPHSYDTTIWRNLAPNGGYDLNFHVSASTTKPGEWRDDGFRFEHESWFSPDVQVLLPSNQTIQVALYANPLDQFAQNNSGAYVNEAYLYYNGGTFQKGGALSVRKDHNATGNSWIDWSTHGYGGSDDRPSPCIWRHGAPFEYVTAVLADDYAAAFFGTSIPTAQTSRYTYNASRRSLSSNPQVQRPNSPGFGLGRIPSNDNKWGMRGEVKNFRFYDRVLSNIELAANRVIDDYRFHGVMPITNVIVATSHSLFSGNERNGNYEIAGSYTFGAPAGTQTDARGFSYAFKGYTLETWDAAAQKWSEPVLHEGENAYAYAVATSPAKVRLTWVWVASGNLRAAADYGLSDYVSSGLILHYDGIKNIGAECDDATNETNRWSKSWVNLANPGMFTLAREDKTTRAGGWETDGFAFMNTSSNVGSRLQYSGAFTLTPSHTWQFLVDARVSEQADATCAYLMFNDAWKQGSLGLRTRSDYQYALYYVPDTVVNDTTGNYRPKILDTKDANSRYDYATAIIDGRRAMLFAGTDYPTDNPNLKTALNAATAQTLAKIRIGGGQGAQDFTGKIKSIRYYDRVLTPEEMRRNRQVDSARYFGELAFTNVVVAVGDNLDVTATPAPGAYAVEGAYVFEVAAGNDTPNGYKLEEWDGAQWTNAQVVESLSYTYDAATSPAMVRVTWRKVNPFVLMMR